jgi:hypothetical protein
MALAFLIVALPAWAAPPDAPPPGARPVLSWSGLDPEGMAFVARAALLGLPSRDVEPSQARKILSELLETRVEPGSFEASAVARALAEGAVAMRDSDPALAGRMAGEATRLLRPLDSWMDDFGEFARVHGFQEPVWVHGRPDVLAQAVLAWISLDEVDSDPDRRERIRRGAEGLKSLLRGNFSTYPFGAHLSAVTAQGRPRTYVVLGRGAQPGGRGPVPGRAAPGGLHHAGVGRARRTGTAGAPRGVGPDPLWIRSAPRVRSLHSAQRGGRGGKPRHPAPGGLQAPSSKPPACWWPGWWRVREPRAGSEPGTCARLSGPWWSKPRTGGPSRRLSKPSPSATLEAPPASWPSWGARTCSGCASTSTGRTNTSSTSRS